MIHHHHHHQHHHHDHHHHNNHHWNQGRLLTTGERDRRPSPTLPRWLRGGGLVVPAAREARCWPPVYDAVSVRPRGPATPGPRRKWPTILTSSQESAGCFRNEHWAIWSDYHPCPFDHHEYHGPMVVITTIMIHHHHHDHHDDSIIMIIIMIIIITTTTTGTRGACSPLENGTGARHRRCPAGCGGGAWWCRRPGRRGAGPPSMMRSVYAPGDPPPPAPAVSGPQS
jgi:hypothetical protein